MSQWEDFNIQASIEEILSTIPTHDPEHHFGLPFITAYQLAIEFARRYPREFEQLDLPIGGRNTGQYYSLTQYLARELSGKIKNRQIRNIEGRFISNLHVTNMTFSDGVESSKAGNFTALSMFRLLT